MSIDYSQLTDTQLSQLMLELKGLEEDPVSIEEFLRDDFYLGRYFSNSFREYWLDVLKKIFPTPGHTDYYLVFLSGCLSAKTKIPLIDGRSLTMLEIANEFYSGNHDMFVLSWNLEKQTYEPDRIINAFSTGVKKVYRIWLDNCKYIDCTSNHKFLDRFNNWVSIDEGTIKYGTSLMPYNSRLGENGLEIFLPTTNTWELQSNLISSFVDPCYKDKNINEDNELIFSDKLIEEPLPEINIPSLKRKLGGKCSPELREELLNQIRTIEPSYFVLTDKSKKKNYKYQDKKYSQTNLRDYAKSVYEQFGSDSKEFKDIIAYLRKIIPNFNHYVTRIEELGEQRVFDITTKNNHNFVTETGIISHNSIGRGKSTTAMAACLYNLYSLLCYKDPQSEFNLVSNDQILFAFMNTTQALADRALMTKFNGMITSSPYFSDILSKRNKKQQKMSLFPKNISIISGSRITHTLGLNILSAIISEASFGILDNQMINLFDSVMARQQSRFMKNGKSAGIIWVDSSEGDISSELAILRDKYKGKPGVYLDTGPLWQVKPEDYVDGRFFYLFTGNEKYQPKILDPYTSDEDKSLLLSGPFIVVPEAHRAPFEADIMRSMRDLAGIPTSSSFRLFRNLDKLSLAMTYEPLFEDIITLEFDDDSDHIQNHCKHIEYFDNPPYPGHPRFIHLDLAYSGDKLGICCGFIMGNKEVKSVSTDSNFKGTSMMPIFCTDFAFSIEAKSGQQIPLYKLRIFIDWLSKTGMSVAGVSADSFNSADLLQSVKLMGIHSQVLSLDRGSDNYISFRNAVYEARIILPRNKLLRTELEHLEMSSDMKKVDHPSVFPDGKIGSKDCADACCGAYCLSVLKAADTAYMSITELSETIKPKDTAVENIFNGLWKNRPTPDYMEQYLREQEEEFNSKRPASVDNFNFWNQ